MYEQHFGLKKRPFSVKATGTEVFVGPQTAKTMAGFRKALAVQDAVVTVSGPVGTGKTTLVERALDAIGTKYKTIRVGRMQMNSSDVLESLLVVLGVQDRPTGTIQRFAALRKKLKELQDAETRVFILVEDAMRAGAETLAELEALTVADAGESDGASIVLMGDERLFDFMRDPQLARLQQRIRQRHKIKALCIAEMLGYLKHSFRMAGGDYERVFDARSAELIHLLSDGIPRIANNLVDSVLVAAAAKRMDEIPATFIANVASDEFGMSAEGFDFSTPEPVAEHMPDPAGDAVTESAQNQSLSLTQLPSQRRNQYLSLTPLLSQRRNQYRLTRRSQRGAATGHCLCGRCGATARTVARRSTSDSGHVAGPRYIVETLCDVAPGRRGRNPRSCRRRRRRTRRRNPSGTRA